MEPAKIILHLPETSSNILLVTAWLLKALPCMMNSQ